MKYLVLYAMAYLLGACVACGTDDIFRAAPTYTTPTNRIYETDIDEELELFVNLFMADCDKRRTDCKKRLERIKEIKVVDIPDLDKTDNELVIGLCYDNIFNRRVHINRAVIDFTDRYLQALMYHELGHCMYGLDHLEQSDRLMSPAIPSIIVLIEDWPELVEEFFAAIRKENGP